MAGNFLMMEGAIEGGERGQQDMMLGMMLNSMEQQNQIDMQREQQAAAERARQKEIARQQELERQRLEAERQRQAELARLQQYQGFMTSGSHYVQDGQYSLAIPQFKQALQLQSNDVAARYNIACCTESLQDIVRAYSLFMDLQSHANQFPDIPVHISNCAATLYQIGSDSLKKAKKFYDEGKTGESTQALNNARACITASQEGSKLKAKIEDFANVMAWDEHSEHVNEQFKIGAEKLQQQEYRLAANILTECIKEYLNFTKYLNDAEIEFKRQTEVLLPQARRQVQRLDNLDRQAHIKSRLVDIKTATVNYDTDSAIKMLQEIVGVCRQINPVADVVDAAYIPLDTLEQSLARVQAFKQEFETRRKGDAQLAAANIVNRVMDGNKLGSDEAAQLQNKIMQILQAQWLSLDRRNLDTLSASLVVVVQLGLEQYNCLAACCYGANFYITDEKTLRDQLTQHVAQNLPNEYRAPITLPLFSQVSQAPRMPVVSFGNMGSQGAEQYPMAQVVDAPSAPPATDIEQQEEAKMKGLTM